jgi:hypothetical protein
MKRSVILVLLLLSLGFLPVASQATITPFTKETDFLEALLPGYYTEDFSTLILDFGDTTHTFSNGVFSYILEAKSELYVLGLDGKNGISTVAPDDPIMGYSFSSSGNPLTAIGGYFYLTDWNEEYAPGTVKVYINDVLMFDEMVTTRTFFGVIDTGGIEKLSLETNGTSGYYASISDLTVGDPAVDAVPLPPSVLLLGSGLLGLVGLRRFKKI